MNQLIRKFMYYKIDENGLPLRWSNVTSNTRPPYTVGTVHAIINAPSPDSAKQPFPGGRRYFVMIDSNGNPIDGTLIGSTLTPEGNYLEMYANGILSLPQGSNQNSGYVPNSLEELANVPVYMSEEYRRNGTTITQFDGKPPVIKKTCYTYQVNSIGGSSEFSYSDCNGVFTKRTINNEIVTFCALDGSPAVVFGTGVLTRQGICN